MLFCNLGGVGTFIYRGQITLRSRFVRFTSAICLLLWLAVALGCGGESGQTSHEDYFRQLEEAYGIFEKRGLERGEIEYESVQEFMVSYFIPDYREFVDSLEDIAPPSDLAQAHKELVTAQTGLLNLLEASNERFAELRSEFDLAAFFDEPDVKAVSDRTAQKCRVLEDVAHDKGIGVDLEC